MILYRELAADGKRSGFARSDLGGGEHHIATSRTASAALGYCIALEREGYRVRNLPCAVAAVSTV
jgi:hypothetical protein